MCNNLSFSIPILLLIAIFSPCLSHEVASDVDDLSLIGTNREALEIIIGGGGEGDAPAPSPDGEDCPPPPPPPCPPPPSPPPPPPPRLHPPLPPKPTPHSPPPPKPTPTPTPNPPRPPPNCGYRNEFGCFETRRIANAFKVIQNFKKIAQPNEFTKTWTGNDVCKYTGFKCGVRPDVNEKAVAAVDFNGANFIGKGNGSLPLNDFIDGLEDLAIYHANSNHFTGKVPVVGVSKINFLYELDLSNNKLESDFPMEVVAAKNLTFLDLRFNNFKGLVPSSVFNLDLDVLFINNNKFRQPLPDNIGDSPVLYLTFANNFFTGPIPKSIGRAPNLLEVLFLNNQFSGCLPYEIGNLSQATVFDVGTNKLTGPIPFSFGCLRKMELLNLANNELYGEVPEIVCQLPKLQNLSLSNNYFTQVGPACRDLITKKKLDVRKNCILDLPEQRSKADCAAFFSRKWSCERKESFKLVPCMKGKQGVGDSDWKSTEESDEESTVSSSPSARTYRALKPHRL